MTITYTHEVANARLSGFSNLLLRWRGSVYKLFYKEFIIYITLYTILSLCYRLIDIPEFKAYFEKLCLQFESYTDLVPISFVLGFYVSMVVGRWWQQFLYIPWPDRLMVIVVANVHGSDQRGRLIRRTLMRYLSLAQVLTYRSISTAVYKRFPTMQHVIDAGFMTAAEYKRYESVKTENVKYFIPCIWFSNLLSKVRQEGRIYEDITYQAILKELNDFRGNCGMLFSYDWISIPLVYTQVVTVAVYVFFTSTLLSRQYLDVEKAIPGHEVDLYVPIFTICQFFFYVGWLKVAEQLINPFGEDDDDFEVNYIIDRNLEISMLTVDSMYLNHPKLEKDKYWNNPNPSIPYTAAAANHKLDAFLGSTIDMSLGRQEMQFIEQSQADQIESNKDQWDINHNRLDVEMQTLLVPPPSYAVAKQQATLRPTNPINLWKRFTGRDKETEWLKPSSSKTNFLSPRVKAGTKEEEGVKEEDDNDTHTDGSDDSDQDSDVGDGGGSEDDGSDDNKSDRRSSLSSLEGGEENNHKEYLGDSQKLSSAMRKHSIAEPDDRPRAKKPKRSLILSPAPSTEPRPPPLKVKSSEKLKRPTALISNASDGNLKNMSTRFAYSKGKKSPKKKNNTIKFLKRSDLQRNCGEETEEERRNAQIRTIGLLKATKKKSVQALQRNARRVNYPGMRNRYPLLWTTDYTSMTSGAEDHGRHDFDSPFGSVNSFGTSIPSPRPLRFSQFGRRGKRKQFDSVSLSSCMTSPCANDDTFPSTALFNASPKAREDVATISMPFTEDLRRRLFVVNALNNNTPSSSNATSPVLSRALQPAFHLHQQMPAASGQENDNLLMVAPAMRTSVSGTAWENTLEVIGEIATSEKSASVTKITDSNTKSPTEPISTASETKIMYRHVNSTTPEAEDGRPNPKVHSHQPVCRSSSCPNVPVSKMTSDLKRNSATKQCSPSETELLFSNEKDSFKVNFHTFKPVPDPVKPLGIAASFHVENEKSSTIQPSKTDSSEDQQQPTDGTKAPYSELIDCCSSELAPLLQAGNSEDESNPSSRTFQLDSGNHSKSEEENFLNLGNDAILGAAHTSASVLPASSSVQHGHFPSGATDMGYYSSKEDCEISTLAPNKQHLKAVDESNTEVESEIETEDSEVPQNIAMPISTAVDVVIDIL